MVGDNPCERSAASASYRRGVVIEFEAADHSFQCGGDDPFLRGDAGECLSAREHDIVAVDQSLDHVACRPGIDPDGCGDFDGEEATS